MSCLIHYITERFIVLDLFVSFLPLLLFYVLMNEPYQLALFIIVSLSHSQYGAVCHLPRQAQHRTY